MLDTIVLFKIALLAGAAGASQLIHGRLYVDQRDIIKRDTYRVTGWFFLGISALALVLLGIGQFLL